MILGVLSVSRTGNTVARHHGVVDMRVTSSRPLPRTDNTVAHDHGRATGSFPTLGSVPVTIRGPDLKAPQGTVREGSG